ncbi:Bax protein [Colwellia chukchiensis]|uniref:Bax protein n=1 Tax=Colwellia chukchiensis TaxID=641665 RepID=A0A1H7H1C9_9GAMM|nr:glucosaminidase domain-containing protein [Colwellia chukchiensis]SEK41915.1 Bax protein [Colwellia chukchiensis]
MSLSLKQIKIGVAALLLVLTAVIYFRSSEKPAPLPPMTVQEKKARFIALAVPAVNRVYDDLMKQYRAVKSTLDSGKSNAQIEKLMVEYKAANHQELLMALKPHPKSIALAQAAMESSWATSRFFLAANNIFGVWSYNENEPRIAALNKRGKKTIWLKKYPSLEASIYDYYRILSRGDAYKAFRKTLMTSNDPFLLVTKLDNYSEKGSAYGEELRAIIKFNHFDDYDNFDRSNKASRIN